MEKNSCINHLNHNCTKTKKEQKEPPLFRLESCPPWLQFNKYILGGYRCHLSTNQCVESLFYIHNETFNIYSHGEYKNVIVKPFLSAKILHLVITASLKFAL